MSTNVSQSQSFCIKLNSHHSDIIQGFHQLYHDETLVDVTVSCAGGTLKAHKVVLSASSNYFKSIFTSYINPCQYPVVIIKDIQFQDLKAILDFMYCGEITVPQSSLQSLLNSARILQVKGLSDVQISSSGTPTSKFNGSKQQSTYDFEMTTVSSTPKRRRRRKRVRRSNSADEDSSSSDLENASPERYPKEVARISDSIVSRCDRDGNKHLAPGKKENQIVPQLTSVPSQTIIIDDAKSSYSNFQSPSAATSMLTNTQPPANKSCALPGFTVDNHQTSRKQWADEESKVLVDAWFAEYTRSKISGDGHLSYKSVCEQLKLRGIDCTPNQVREKVRALKNNYNAIKLGTAKQLVRNHMSPFLEKLQVVLEDSGPTEFSPQGVDGFSSSTFK